MTTLPERFAVFITRRKPGTVEALLTSLKYTSLCNARGSCATRFETKADGRRVVERERKIGESRLTFDMLHHTK